MSSPALKFAVYRFELEPRVFLFAPQHQRGTMLRGAFGWMFRGQVCPDIKKDCQSCELQAGCPYHQIFSPTTPPEAERLSKNLHPPRPFILRPDISPQEGYQAGELFSFELVLVGYCLDFLPYFIVAFLQLGELGIGSSRAKYRLKRIVGLNPFRGCEEEEIYQAGHNQVKSYIHHPVWWEDVEKKAEQLPSEGVTLRFQSPTEIKADGHIVREPKFHHIFKRLRDRINALSYFYCGQALDIPFAELGKLAEEIKTVHSSTCWLSRTRKSKSSGQDQVLSGFLGDIGFAGCLTPFLPFLAIGEYLHVGKDVAFGNGRFEVLGPTRL